MKDNPLLYIALGFVTAGVIIFTAVIIAITIRGI